MIPSVVVFDIGGVLVDWKPHLAWEPELGAEETAAFMERVAFADRNTRADAGERFDSLASEIKDPEDRARLANYVDLYPRTVCDQIPGTWALLDALRARGTPLHAITNWSAETWPEGLKSQPRLAEVFGTIVISGEEKIMKPDHRIFERLCARANVAPEDCVFIDDSPKNVTGARAAGMDAIHFTNAPALKNALKERGLL